MPILARVAPLTPLDALRTLLADFAEGDGNYAIRLTQSLQGLRKQALPVLGPMLRPGAASKGLRRLLLSLVAKFDWPEWAVYIRDALLQEQDLGLFDEGCAALGLLGTREAFEALKRLQEARTDPDRQVILHRELAQYLAQQPFSHYLGRLLEGSGNPRLAVQGARVLAAIAEPSDLPALVEAFRNSDEVVSRLALRILAGLPGSESTQFFLDLLERTTHEIQDNLALLEILHRTQNLPRGTAKDEFLRLVAVRFAARLPEPIRELQEALAKSAEDFEPAGFLEPFQAALHGHTEGFLVEALSLLLESKVARYTAFHSETSDQAEARQERLGSALDQAAESLARRVDMGQATVEEVVPALSGPFRLRMGGDAYIHAFLRLLPAREESLLAEILAEPELRRRQRCIDALGSREDDAFTPFFLKAMQDSIIEVGQLASHHLGKLPSSLPSLMSQFETGHPDQVRRAIWAFGENQTREAAGPLLAYIQKDQRDELLVEAVDALANIGNPEAVPTFLDLLHDGKPLALQVSLARALSMLATPAASLGLLQKASHLKHPQVLILCLEGTLAGFPGFDRPLPPEHLPALLALVERCSDDREGAGQRVPAMLAMQDLYTFDQGIYEKLKDRFSDFLFDMRTKDTWDRESNDRVAAVVKELGRRSASLGLLAKKEAEIQAQIQKIPETGPRRAEALLGLREALSDPEFIIRPELAQGLAEMVLRDLGKKDAEWKELAHLCEIGGLTRRQELVEPVRAIYLRATGLGLKSAARKSLLDLGLTEVELNRKPPVRSILVLEPSAFFRKRLTATLEAKGRWKLLEAGNRQEAQSLLETSPVDLVISETQDGEGELGPWLESQWNQERCRAVLFSASSRDLGLPADTTWVEGTLFKPYPMEQLLRAIEN
jgi:HEAT repeat protein